jgi:uncharacterized delta-60 repeat protein
MRLAMSLLAFVALLPSPVRAHDGDLDPAFNGGSPRVVSFDLDPSQKSDYAEAVAVQPDGRIVVAGSVTVPRGPNVDADFGITRLLPDGSLDTSFGDASTPGMTHVDFPAASGSGHDYGQFLALAPDGGIYVGGLLSPSGGTRLGVVRLLPNGHIDTTWANGGRFVMTRTGHWEFNAALVQPDGKLVIVGRYDPGDVSGQASGDFWILRLAAGGNLDSTFGNAGEVVVPIDISGAGPAKRDRATCVTRLADGSLLVGGSAQMASTTDTAFAVVKLRANGTRDTSFDDDGIWAFDMGSYYNGARGIAVDSKGRIVIAGVTGDTDEYVPGQYVVIRLLPNGALDWDLNGTGYLSGIYVAGQTANAWGVAVQSDRKIVIAGTTRNGSDDTRDFAVARFNEDGSYDLGFGIGGIRTAHAWTHDDVGRGVALQNGRIVVAGASRYQVPDDWDFAVLRLTGDVIFADGLGN